MKSRLTGRLPIPLTDEEESRTVACSSSSNIKIGPFTKMCVIRPNVARTVVEDGVVVVYHCLDNGRELFQHSMNPLEFELDDGPAIEKLLSSNNIDDEENNNGIVVADLPHTSEELHEKVAIAEALFKEGLLIITESEMSLNSQQSNGLENVNKKRKNIEKIPVVDNMLNSNNMTIKKNKIEQDDDDCPF